MKTDNRQCQVKTQAAKGNKPFVDLSGLHDVVQGPGPVPLTSHNSTFEDELLLKTSLLDMASDAMFLHDLQGNFVYVNQACASMSGFSREELLNANVLQMSSDKSVMDIESRYDELREKGEIVVETMTVTKDGTSHCLEVHSRLMEIGGNKYISCTAHDITRRKQADKELKASYAKLQKTLDGFINTIATVSETRDPYTAGHQRQVSRLAHAIAGEMHLDDNTCEAIRIAGILHDIGKLSIPAEILSKPGKLSTAEFAIIKRHPEVGRDILQNIDFPWPICGIVSQHHERLDGSGYPDGLAGNNICVEAKILAVADVVEAMASHRPYRPSLGIEVALDEVKKNKGTKYDMDAVDACVRLVNQKGFSLS